MRRESEEGSAALPATAVHEPTDPSPAAGAIDPTHAQGGRHDLIVGLLALMLGVAYLGAIASQVSAETDGMAGVSGRTLPYLIGGILALLGAALTAKSVLRRPTALAAVRDAEEPARWRRAALMIALVAGYWLGATHLGYVLSSAVALLAAMWFSGARKGSTILVVALLVPPLMYWFFHVVMQIPLPEALLF